jgi:hypothetical protein
MHASRLCELDRLKSDFEVSVYFLFSILIIISRSWIDSSIKFFLLSLTYRRNASLVPQERYMNNVRLYIEL